MFSVDIHKSFNNHSTAEIIGMVSISDAKNYSQNYSNENVKIELSNQNDNMVVFNGLIKNLEVSIEGDIAILNLSLISYSFLMDINKHTRTFQDKNMTYGEVTEAMIDSSEVGNIMSPQHSSTAISSMLVQYKETDWEFAKRMASRIGTVVVTDNSLDFPMISLGIISKSNKADFIFDKFSICTWY